MGYIWKVSCEKCGYEEQFPLGAGRRDCDFEQVLAHYDEMDADNLEFLNCVKKKDFSSFQYRLGRCQSCGKLAAVPVFSFRDGSQFIGGTCECGVPYEKAEILETEATLGKEKEMTCPVCGKDVQVGTVGIWD